MLTSLKSYAFFITKAFIPLHLNNAGRVRYMGMRKLTALFLGLILVTSCGEIQTTYKNGKIEGPYERYYKKGQLREKGTYKDGKKDGPYVYYHRNGQLKKKVNYRDGKAQGLLVEYHENGQLKEKGNYKDGVKMSD